MTARWAQEGLCVAPVMAAAGRAMAAWWVARGRLDRMATAPLAIADGSTSPALVCEGRPDPVGRSPFLALPAWEATVELEDQARCALAA